MSRPGELAGGGSTFPTRQTEFARLKSTADGSTESETPTASVILCATLILNNQLDKTLGGWLEHSKAGNCPLWGETIASIVSGTFREEYLWSILNATKSLHPPTLL